MDRPKIAQKGPFVMELEPGKYWWCACGRSNNQPFCDGSHKVTSIKPIALEIAEKRKVAFCGCKHTGKQPYCDGTHKGME